MGCACSCRRQETSGFSLSSWRCYNRRCCFCGMCSVVHPFSGKRGTTSSRRSTSVPQSTGLLDITTRGALLSGVSNASADIQQDHISITSPCPNVASIEVESPGFGSITGAGDGLTASEQIKEQDLQKQEAFPVSKPKSRFGSIESIMILLEDEDSCPICLEEYDKENPRIETICEHHYHLGCILEWMERSDNCPMCDKEVVFYESL